MLAGDEEEHAILLCNYFKYRNRAAYVVLGTGIPEGSTAYVLTLDDGYRLWNAYTGEQFDVHDANCPLKSIGCVFNEENVSSHLALPRCLNLVVWGGIVKKLVIRPGTSINPLVGIQPTFLFKVQHILTNLVNRGFEEVGPDNQLPICLLFHKKIFSCLFNVNLLVL